MMICPEGQGEQTMRVLVTRPTEDAERLAVPLRALGIGVMTAPLLAVVDHTPDSLPDLGAAGGLLLTSANGARALKRLLHRSPAVGDAVYAVPVLAVGEHTACVLQDAGFNNVQSADGDGAALFELVCRTFGPDAGPLYHLAGAEIAGDLAGDLRKKGYDCTHIPLYETQPIPLLPSEVVSAFRTKDLDGVVLCSARTAKVFISLVRQAGLESHMASVTAWCLSRAVADAVSDLKFDKVHIAEAPQQDSLLDLFRSVAGAGQEGTPTGATEPDGGVGRAKQGGTTRWRIPVLALGVLVALVLVGSGWLSSVFPRLSVPLDLPLISRDATVPEMADVAALRGELDDVRAALGNMRQTLDQTRYRLALAEQQIQQGLSDLTLDPEGESEPGADDNSLQERMNALQAALQGIEARMLPPRDDAINAMGRRIDELSRDRIGAGTVLGLADRVAAMEEQVRRTSGRQERVVAFLLAVGQLREAIDTGRPYGLSLRTVRALMPEGVDPTLSLSTLHDYADSGIATPVALDRQLSDLVPAIIRAGYGPDDQSAWWARTVDALTSVVSVRRVDGADVAEFPAAVTARAVEAASGGDLASAVAELSRLSGQAVEVAQPWIQMAQARLAANAALEVLTDEAVVRLGTGDPLPPRKSEG